MARITLNTKVTSPADLAKHLRSVAAKLDVSDLTPGADITVGNTRIQVAETQESDIRAFARENGIPVGSRGRYSKELQERFAAHQKAERKRKREEAAARRAERQAVAV